MDSIQAGALSGVDRDELMQQVKQEIALANAQELLTKMTEKCFKKCVTKPGTSLDSSEQKCVAMCMDRYMDAFNVVSKAYSDRLQRERNRMNSNVEYCRVQSQAAVGFLTDGLCTIGVVVVAWTLTKFH